MQNNNTNIPPVRDWQHEWDALLAPQTVQVHWVLELLKKLAPHDGDDDVDGAVRKQRGVGVGGGVGRDCVVVTVVGDASDS